MPNSKRLLPLALVLVLGTSAFLPAQDALAGIPPDMDAVLAWDHPMEGSKALQQAPWYDALLQLFALENPSAPKDIGNFFATLARYSDLLEQKIVVAARGQGNHFRWLAIARNTSKLGLEAAAAKLGDLLDLDLELGEVNRVPGGRVADAGPGVTVGRSKSHLVLGATSAIVRRALRRLSDPSTVVPDAYGSLTSAAKGVRLVLPDGLFLKEFKSNFNLGDTDEFLSPLLLGGITNALASTKSLFAELVVGPQPTLRVEIDRPESHSPQKDWKLAFRRPPLLNIHLGRDLATLWRQRDQWVPKGAEPALAEFTSTMNIFLGGYDFDDLMSELKPGVAFVASLPIAGKAKTRPELLLPSFALMFRTRFDTDLRRRFEAAFQTFLAVTNANSTEEAQQPILLRHEKTAVGTLCIARRLSDPVNGRKGSEYNFEPTLLQSGDRLIIATRPDLAVHLARLGIESTVHGDDLDVDGAALAEILRLNRERLEEQALVERGAEEDEARRFADRIIGLARAFRGLRLRSFDHEHRRVLTLSLEPAKP